MAAPKGLKRRDFMITSAALPRLAACPGSGCYVNPRKEKVSFGQWYGIFVHRFLEYCVDRSPEEALAWIHTKRLKNAIRTCERIDTDRLYYGQAEVGWCHNPFDDTSRRVPWSLMATVDVEREQFGKADLVVELGVPRPMIADYKCGGLDGRPADNSQLLGLAASYRAETGAPEIDVAIAGVMSTGEIHWSIQTVDGSTLNRYVDHTRRVHARILDDRRRADAGIEPDFARGPHCEWCRLQKLCPAWK